MDNSETDCREVLNQLYLYLDGEIEGDCAVIERHLAACRSCLQRKEFEQAFKDLVRKRCCENKLPEGFVERLRVTVFEQRFEGPI